MDSSLGFGSTQCNWPPCSDSLSLRLRDYRHLTLLHKVTRRLILQKARGHFDKSKLPHLVSIRFQVLFHSPPGVLFAFPSRYLFAIGHWLVFSLTRWSSQIPTGFHVSRGTQVAEPGRSLSFHLRGYHPLWLSFQRIWLR